MHEDDLQEEDIESTLELANAARVLEMSRSEGWLLLKRDLESYSEILQDEINTVGNNEMVYTGKDLKILELNMLKQILQFPEKFLLRIQMKRTKTESFDAYSTAQEDDDIEII